MTAVFPPTIQSITGMPTFSGLLGAYRHSMCCAQSQCIVYSALNWLCLVVPQNIWDMHSTDTHPDPPENPGLASNYGLVGAPLDIIQAKDTYNNNNKNFQEEASIKKRT